MYKGRDEILLSKLILHPTHSILTQSYDSRLRLVRETYLGPRGDGIIDLSRIHDDHITATVSASVTTQIPS